MPQFSLTFSLAEQSFSWTRSIGLLNLSVKMLEHIARRPEVSRLTVLSNDSFRNHLQLPPAVSIRYHNEANGRGLSRMFWDQWKIYTAAKEAGNDWLFMPKGFVSFVRKCPVKLAAYVPDVMFNHYERNHPGKFSKLEGIYLKQSVKAALKEARVIFTCSEFTNAEIRRVAKEEWGFTRLPALIAIGTGFSTELQVAIPKADRILALASPWAHKRTDLAVAYLERWQKETGFKGKIDWVGAMPEGMALPAHPGWELFQRVPEKEYREMVARARALVYFTEYEGFGMPPVESIIAGTCSVYSDVPATREVMSGQGQPFLNDSYASFATALNAAIQTTPAQLQDWTQKLLARHNWENGAERIIQAMVASEPGR